MPVPVLQRQGHRFSERNTYVDAVLGMVAAGRRLDDLVRSAAASAPPEGAARPAEDDENDRVARAALLDFVLGLVSVSRTVRSHAEGWAAATAPTIETPPSSAVRSPGLLR